MTASGTRVPDQRGQAVRHITPFGRDHNERLTFILRTQASSPLNTVDHSRLIVRIQRPGTGRM